MGRWLRLLSDAGQSAPATGRGRVDHVVILDGTMSSLMRGAETNAGLTCKLLSENPAGVQQSLRYEAGIQWRHWRDTMDVIQGAGINRQIRRAYGFLASRYRLGDRIFLFGYSRGAYAVRSLAGVIDTVGLLRAGQATERNIRTAYRHYERGNASDVARQFSELYCHDRVEIEMVGVWDTVKALGLRAPLLWKIYENRYAFHNPHPGPTTRHGYHALAMDETREIYSPVLWECSGGCEGHVEQVWFRGTHADIGGQVGAFREARPLANIPLVWMLERAEALGLALPDGWRARFPANPLAPSLGTMCGWGKFFLARRRRMIGADPSERIHESAVGHRPVARIVRDDLFDWQTRPGHDRAADVSPRNPDRNPGVRGTT